MSFGFGALPGLPQGMTAEDIAKLLSSAPVSSQVAAQGNPLSFLERRRAMNGAEDGAAQAGLFGGNAMGAPQGFGFGPLAPAGNVVAEQGQSHGEAQTAADLQAVMSPKVAEGSPARVEDDPRPMQATLRMPRPAGPAVPTMADPRTPGFGFGPLPISPAAPVQATDVADAAEADLPGKTAVPTMGKASPAMPVVPTTPAAAAPVPAPDGGFDFGAALQRFNAKGGGDFLMGLGSGLMTTRGFGAGLGAGIQQGGKMQALAATSQLANADLALKQQKLAKETRSENATLQQIKRLNPGISDEDAAARAANPAYVNELLKTTLPSTEGYRQEKDEDGNLFSVNTRTGQKSLVLKADEKEPKLVTRTLADGSTQQEWIKPGTSSGTAIGQPAPPDKPQSFDTESKLRTEFTKNLGSFQDVHDGYGRVIASTEQRAANPKAVSPASDISLVFGYMKMLDPGSVVREGEYATAANAAGMPERVRNAYNKALSGEFLSPEQRQDFVEQADRLYGKARGAAEGVAERYRGLAGQYNVDPSRSVYLPEPYKASAVGPSRTIAPAGAGPALDVGGARDVGGGITIKRVR